MRDEIADIVFPVLRQGIRLRQRLQSNLADKVDWQREQKEILGLLQATPKARDAVADYLGDHYQADAYRSNTGTSPRYDTFLGIRYALACWIDEIMILSNLPKSWSSNWNENKIESQLFGGNLRAEKFWDQAKKAQVRPSRDPLEVFYLCVVLGFRGAEVEHPERVKAWKDQVQAQIAEDHPYAPPPDQNCRPNVPSLTGAKRKQSMVLVATIATLVFLFALIIGIIIRIGKTS